MLSMKILAGAAVLVIPAGAILHGMMENNENEARSRWLGTPLAVTNRYPTPSPSDVGDEDPELSKVIDQLRPLKDECLHLPDARNHPRLVGKAVIWDDVDAPRPSEAQPRLPRNLQGSASDLRFTVILIANKSIRSLPLHAGGAPRIQVDLDVCVFSWPDKKSLGHARIAGKEPPKLTSRQTAPIYGDTIEPLVDWVIQLRRAPDK